MDLKTLNDTPPWGWPEGADKMLLKILRDDRTDQSDCLLAAELAGDSTVRRSIYKIPGFELTI